METSIVKLKASSRADTGKSANRRLRRTGVIPAISYGRGNPSMSLAVSPRDLGTILTSERGRNSVIELEVEGAATKTVMVKDFSVHPMSRRLVHADFIEIDIDQPLEVEVPFRTSGKSKGELAGGTVLQTVRRVPVKCMPANIPDVIVVDVSALDIDDGLSVADLPLPAGVELQLPSELRLVVVKAPRMEEEKPAEAAVAEGAPAEGAGAKPEEKKDEKKKD